MAFIARFVAHPSGCASARLKLTAPLAGVPVSAAGLSSPDAAVLGEEELHPAARLPAITTANIVAANLLFFIFLSPLQFIFCKFIIGVFPIRKNARFFTKNSHLFNLILTLKILGIKLKKMSLAKNAGTMTISFPCRNYIYISLLADCSRNIPGEVSVYFLNTRIKFLALENPVLNPISSIRHFRHLRRSRLRSIL